MSQKDIEGLQLWLTKQVASYNNALSDFAPELIGSRIGKSQHQYFVDP